LEGEIIKIDTNKVADYSSFVINEIREELLNRMFFDTVYVDTIQYKKIGHGAQLDEFVISLVQMQLSHLMHTGILTTSPLRVMAILSITPPTMLQQ